MRYHIDSFATNNMHKKEKSVFDCPEFPLGTHLTTLSKFYVGALRKRLEHLDIERYYSVLILIEHKGLKCTQQYIADFLQKDKATMVGIIDYLVEKKYIKRIINPTDRREHYIQLTGKSIKTLPELHQCIDELNLLAIKGLSKSKVKEFYKNLQLISVNLSKEPAFNIHAHFEKIK